MPATILLDFLGVASLPSLEGRNIQSLTLKTFPSPILQCSLGLRCRSCIVDVTIGTGLPQSVFPSIFSQFFISVLVSTDYTKEGTLMGGESVAFLFTDDKHAEKEVLETPQFTITSK